MDCHQEAGGLGRTKPLDASVVQRLERGMDLRRVDQTVVSAPHNGARAKPTSLLPYEDRRLIGPACERPGEITRPCEVSIATD